MNMAGHAKKEYNFLDLVINLPAVFYESIN